MGNAGNPVGADIVRIKSTTLAMDGSDETAALKIEYTNGNHTGSSNKFMGIEIDGITADAEASEYAISIGDGWDKEFYFPGSGVVIEQGVNTGTIQFNDSSVGILQLSGVVNTQPVVLVTSQLRTDGSTEGLAVEPVLNAMNGTDTWSILEVDVTNADHTGSTNVLNGISVDAITADAQALEYGIYVESGWEGSNLGTTTQANLAAMDNGTIIYCSDCNPDATCTGSGAGAFAFRIAGAWACELN
jgi:hypothetical protein